MRKTGLVLLVGVAGCSAVMRNPGTRTIDPWQGAVLESASVAYNGHSATFTSLPLYVRRTSPRHLLVRDTVWLSDSIPGLPRTAEFVMGFGAKEAFRYYSFALRFTGRSICMTEAPLYDDGRGSLVGRAQVRTMQQYFYARVVVRRDSTTGRGEWSVRTDDGRLDLRFAFRARRPGDPPPPALSQPLDSQEEGDGVRCRRTS